MQPIEVREGIYWVGAIDWNLRDFHGYSTEKGTTYNSFLLLDEKVVLFDTVKKEFKEQLIQRIRRIVEPEKIDYIIVNHVEMDHSGALPEMVEIIKPEKILCSPLSKKALQAHFHREDWPYQVVQSGESVQLGKRSVQFLETRMLHWPDSMFSYIPEEELLISSDAFGQHWATSERFDDEVDQAELFRHAAKYYANILLPLSSLVSQLLKQVREMGLRIKTIAPDHGLIWRSSAPKIIEAYGNWCEQRGSPKALIIYDTMWHSTDMMAEAIAEGLMEKGIGVKLLSLKENHRSDIMTEALEARAIVLGSPTLNRGVLPKVADMLAYMKGLRPRNKIGAAFGSYGWSGEAVEIINKALEEMQFKLIDPGIKVNYVPSPEDLKRCRDLGVKIAEALREEP